MNLDETRDAELGFTLLLTGWTVTRGPAFSQRCGQHLLPRAPQPLLPPTLCLCLFLSLLFFLLCARETISTDGGKKRTGDCQGR